MENSNVPSKYGITGLGPIFVRVKNLDHIRVILENILGFKETAHSDAFINLK